MDKARVHAQLANTLFGGVGELFRFENVHGCGWSVCDARNEMGDESCTGGPEWVPSYAARGVFQ